MVVLGRVKTVTKTIPRFEISRYMGRNDSGEGETVSTVIDATSPTL